ncbi:MAG: hypothetical protein R3B09_10825 [Nannocystaceae bacterium]
MRHSFASLIRSALVGSAMALVACSGSTSDTTDGATEGSSSTTTTSTTTSTSTTTTTSTSTTTTTTTTTSTSTTGVETTSTTAVTGTTLDTSTTEDPGSCIPVACDGKIYQCGDCVDNDNDGKIDKSDVECLSPCDDDEGHFASGLPGDNMDPCNQDCYFDGNSGAGDDKCNWSLKCDPMNPGGDDCPYDPDYKNCPDSQNDTCLGFCPVPNGCDCFGCCTITVNGVDYDIFLGDKDCSVATIDQCAKCSKNDQCDNVCIPENCEVCFGQDLPPGCDMPTCDNADACTVDNMGNDNCADGFFCSTGCCVPIIPG